MLLNKSKIIFMIFDSNLLRMLLSSVILIGLRGVERLTAKLALDGDQLVPLAHVPVRVRVGLVLR